MKNLAVFAVIAVIGYCAFWAAFVARVDYVTTQRQHAEDTLLPRDCPADPANEIDTFVCGLPPPRY